MSVCIRSRHSFRGVSRGSDQTSSVSFLGDHLLPHAADSWTGYHGNCCSFAVCALLYVCTHILHILPDKRLIEWNIDSKLKATITHSQRGLWGEKFCNCARLPPNFAPLTSEVDTHVDDVSSVISVWASGSNRTIVFLGQNSIETLSELQPTFTQDFSPHKSKGTVKWSQNGLFLFLDLIRICHKVKERIRESRPKEKSLYPASKWLCCETTSVPRMNWKCCLTVQSWCCFMQVVLPRTTQWHISGQSPR